MNNNSPENAEIEIASYLDLANPQSFLLFAAAGSGKTRSLVNVLRDFKEKHSETVRHKGQQVAIITYTNAACDEIKNRLEHDSIFHVSTIHSFSWDVICQFQHDIRQWLKNNLNQEITVLQEAKGRPNSQATRDRAIKIEVKKHRLQNLDSIKKFNYSPNGNNSKIDSLQHSEVINIAADFLQSEPLMQLIFISKYPILLIDESQDTNKKLMEALFKLQSIHNANFSLGLFGDMMQKIYSDGIANLETEIPKDFKKPVKSINHRCPKRIIQLLNQIREGSHQQSGKQNEEGFVRYFIVNESSEIDKQTIENDIKEKMYQITKDKQWKPNSQTIKILTLEHLMAAKRSGFYEFFEPLYQLRKDRTGLYNGTLSGIPFLIKQLLPLIEAYQAKDDFKIATLFKQYSPTLSRNSLQQSNDQLGNLHIVHANFQKLTKLWVAEKEPLLIEILKKIQQLKLLSIPEVLLPIARRNDDELMEDNKQDKVISGWVKALQAPFSQLKKYSDYISDQSSFATHQGIKGLEFPRVMAILDDKSSRGWMFKYDELLLGNKNSSQNNNESEESRIDRTKKLFYVICSRSQKSLAIVHYTKIPQDIKESLISMNWFSQNEIIFL